MTTAEAEPLPLRPVLLVARSILVGDLRLELTADVVRQAVNHGLAPKLLQLVDHTGAPVDPTVLAQLRAAVRASALRGLAVAGLTVTITLALAEAGVRALVFKGAALGAQLGDPVGTRPSADTDLLVSPADVDRADEVLRGLGWTEAVKHPGLPARVQRWLEQEATYVGGPACVDLHWRLDTAPAAFSEPFEQLWQRRDEVLIGRQPVPTLNPVDALLLTAVHGTKELWWGAKWLVDAGRQVAALDAHQLQAAQTAANQVGARRALATTIALAGLLSGRDVPVALDRRAVQLARATLANHVGEGLPQDWRSALGRRLWKWQHADTITDGFRGAGTSTVRQLLALAGR